MTCAEVEVSVKSKGLQKGQNITSDTNSDLTTELFGVIIRESIVHGLVTCRKRVTTVKCQ